ncbi:MAG: SDR family NAD(P)-dependent oxidoreductase [Solirubrobacterales bacterium]
MRLAGAHALVTGASSGIGAAIARELARRGARVTLVARGRAAMEELAGEIRADGGQAEVEAADLSRTEEVEALAARVLAGAGAPDVLVNNAGAGRWLAVDETPAGEAQQMIALPYLAAFETTRALLPAMIERGSGRVVCMTSLAGWSHIPGAAGYAVARWAMRAFANQLRTDLRGTGVGITLIAPAEVDSPYFDHNPGARERIPRISVVLGGATTPETVARYTADAIERERNQVIVPRRAAAVVKLTPKPVMDWLVRRTGWRRSS